MACKLLKSLLVFVIAVVAPSFALAQSGSGSARKILQLSTAEQVAFIDTTIDQGFPTDRMDAMTILVINRSELAVPLLLANIEQALNSPSASERSIYSAVEMIAYAGDEQAIQAIGRLVSIDEKRFGRYVGRTLDNASNWRNPFNVAYQALEKSDKHVAELTAKWVEANLDAPGPKRQWAAALVERYGRVPTASDLQRDPILLRLQKSRATGITQDLIRLAKEPKAQQR